MAANKSAILIVDDTPANLDLLSDILSEWYTIYVAISGARALEILKTAPISLVLLDVQMPEMDGFEVCRRIKQNPNTAEIPLIFLTALTGEHHEEQGLSLGAVDYITKPFIPHLVRARVATHVQLFCSRQELQHEKEAVEKAYDKQNELEKVRDSLVHMIVHDLRSPLSGILGGLDLAIELAQGSDEPTQRDELIELLHDMSHATSEMSALITTILDINRLESGVMPIEMSDVRIIGTLQTLIKNYEHYNGKQRHIELITSVDPNTIISSDKSLLTRIISNFISNALKYTPHNKHVDIIVENVEGRLAITVRDYGVGLDEESVKRVFDKYWQVQGDRRYKGASSGLGLSFCKLACDTLGATINVASTLGEGSSFSIGIPFGVLE